MSAKPEISMISPDPRNHGIDGRLRLEQGRPKPSKSPRRGRISHEAERGPHVWVGIGNLRHNSQRLRLHLRAGKRIVASPGASGLPLGLVPVRHSHIHARRPNVDDFVKRLFSPHRLIRGALIKLPVFRVPSSACLGPIR